MKNIGIICFAFIAGLGAVAADARDIDFEKFFCDSTLRVDMILNGNSSRQDVSLVRTQAYPGWYGRRCNLDALPVEGNGSVALIDPESGDTIYRQSFSTLFQEWVLEEEAARRTRAFEHTVLVPRPLRPVLVNVALTDSRRRNVASLSYILDPSDILIERHDSTPATPYRYIHKGGDPREAIDIAVVAEGYSKESMDLFSAHASEAAEALLEHEPFASYADRINIVAVESVSPEDGVSIPRLGLWRDSAVGSNFSTFYSDRYLTTSNVYRVHDLLEGIPYEHIIILANTEEYGGGGIYNSYTLTTTSNPKFRPVVVHEFGHSFGGLADEYFGNGDSNSDTYPLDVEPWEQNVTTLVDFGSKWADMMPEGRRDINPGTIGVKGLESYPVEPVGLYEGGAYSAKGVYRPADFCRMRVNEADAFCPVCRRALERMILFHLEERH